MATTTKQNGRFGNQIIRNLSVSLIAEKNNLYVEYCSYELIKDLGIDLFIGKNKYNNTIALTDENYLSILQKPLRNNLNPNNNFFQTQEIINVLYNYLQSDKIKTNIINKNPFKDRYNANNDLCVHIRLTDVEKYNPGLDYYLKAISNIEFENLFITTDDPYHEIIQQIAQLYSNLYIVDTNEIQTLQFSSTCKNVILSHGSFSAVIGYLSFFSNVHYPEYDVNKMWYGDMFSINGWNKINITQQSDNKTL
jgi:hypothetical protein